MRCDLPHEAESALRSAIMKGMTTQDVADTDGDEARPLRADAARNRELILRTAAEVFAEQGLEAGYDEIARRAGIGVGTVYRRFPERAELVQALFESRLHEVVAIAEEAAARSDAWEGLAGFLEKTLQHHVADRGLKEVMIGAVDCGPDISIGRERLGPIVGDMVARAKADGAIRADAEATDLWACVMVMSSMTTPEQPELWRRYLALFLEGLRCRDSQPTLPLEAPSEVEMHAMTRRLQGR